MARNYGKHPKNVGVKECLECLQSFSKSPNKSWRQFKEQKYCNLKCFGKVVKRWIKGRSPTKGKTWKVTAPFTDERRAKISGANASNWKGGVTPINEKLRKSAQYKKWRCEVFERDHYTCMECGIKGGNLNADHIKPFAFFPELRFAVSNGRTLCINCHRKTATYGTRAWRSIKVES